MKKLLLFALAIFCLGTSTEAQRAEGSPLEANMETQTQPGGKILVAYFSWSGNTRGIAQQIHAKTGGDLFEIECVKPYSSNYNTCLEEAQRDQRTQARPALKTHVANIAQYDTILLGYPNWWASIPAPVASFLEEYDLSGGEPSPPDGGSARGSGKTIIPFCSHGGGRFGQSLTAIAKLAPRSKIGSGLSVHYSGGSSLPNDITAWLRKNGVAVR